MSEYTTMRECLMLDIRNLEDQRDFAISEMERLKRERDKARTELDLWRDGNILHEIHRNELEEAERERDEANNELHKQLVNYDLLFEEVAQIRIERDEAREELIRYKRQWDEARSENVEDAK